MYLDLRNYDLAETHVAGDKCALVPNENNLTDLPNTFSGVSGQFRTPNSIVGTGIRLAEIRKTRVGAGMPRRDANEMKSLKIHLPDVFSGATRGNTACGNTEYSHTPGRDKRDQRAFQVV
jgi:hypothetical protein